MKKIIFLLIFFTTWINQGQSLDSLFVHANNLYKQEKYTEALEKYQDIEKNDVVSAELYFNMANVYYRMNQVAFSIYYYEKALKLDPNNEDIIFNLDFAKQMTLDNIEALPKSLGQKFRESVILKFSYDNWAVIAISFAFIFAVLFLLYHFSYNTSVKRIYFITSIICVIFVSLSVFFASRNMNYVKNVRTAIIFSTLAQVKSAPTKSSEVNFELHEGTKVSILENLDNWLKIKIADGKTGWIKVDELKEI